MDPGQLKDVEQACLDLYDSRDEAATVQAQEFLIDFETQPDCVEKCQYILDQSQSPYACSLAARVLTNIVSSPSCPLELQQRLDIRNYCLEFLGTRLPLEHYVVADICRLICRIVKLGWLDNSDPDVFPLRDLPSEVDRFLTGSVPQCIVGVRIFQSLVLEMNETMVEQGLTKHRKIMSSFRDTILFKIFQTTLDITNKLVEKQIDANPAEETRLTEAALSLAHACLAFDFLGTNSDESSDDTRTAQLPSSWRDTIVDSRTMDVYFQLYMTSSPPISNVAMTCLVQFASARRTLFTNALRATYLGQLLRFINEVFRTQHGLNEGQNYHEFCRLLSRLKTNYQLSELVAADEYEEFISSVADFTIDSFAAWKWAGNSVHYLLSLWDRLVSSIPYVRSEKPHLLDTHSPGITEAYIVSCVNSVEEVLREDLENPLEDIEALEQQMRQISVIARCQFDLTCGGLIEMLDPLVVRYVDLVKQPLSTDELRGEYQLLDGQITWLIFIVGAVIGSRAQASPTEAYDALDADLICRALDLMRSLDEVLEETGFGSEQLNVAFINFLQHFRLSFISDTIPKHGRLYSRLHETIGLEDEGMVLDVLVQKIVTNLQFWSESDLIISKTLDLLTALCMGYSSLRRLVKSERVQYILANHSPREFPFLELCDDTRHRTTFYTALGRVVASETTENDTSRFERFLMPLDGVMTALKDAISSGPDVHDNQEVRKALIGAFRDVRGILESVTSKPAFAVMFDWLYPDYVGIMIEAVSVWYDDPHVAVPILKCMAEFVTNKNSRLQMHTSSPNGILLFRETSKILQAYGERVITIDGLCPTELYPVKYKGITVCFGILKAALLGDYVNFGVFPLYGDDALDVAFTTFFTLLTAVPIEDIIAYPKMCRAYYSLLVAITRDHLAYLASLDADTFAYFSSSIIEGIKSVDVQICTQCCTSLDYLISNVVLGRTKSKPQEQSEQLAQHLESVAEMLNDALLYLVNLIMFEECKNQWSVSRPLLGLIILQPEIFAEAQQHIISMLPPHKHDVINDSFKELMEDVEDNLSSRNRDKFTQNLAIFRRDVNNFAKSAAEDGAAGDASASGSRGRPTSGDIPVTFFGDMDS